MFSYGGVCTFEAQHVRDTAMWLFTEGEVTQYFCETCMRTQPQALLFGSIIRSNAAFSLIWSAVYTVIYRPGEVS